MSTRQTNRLIEYLRRFARYDGAGRTDGQLLDSFVQRQDDAAFAALVRRHGPMVWGVCCRMLRSHHDAEDAFQAAFLVLVQKAATLPDKETVGNWLYGVAHQTAVRMRALAAKRGARERQVAAMPEPTSAEQYVWNDLRPVLDEELARLPAKYRTVLVLCDLEGKTRKEVARQLAIPEGTVASRLATARAMLAKRLARRGVVVSGLLLGSVLTGEAASAGVPLAVASATIKAATLVAAGHAVAELVSPSVAALVTGVTKAMAVTKIKGVLAVLVVVGLAVGGGGVGVGLFPNPMAVAQQPATGPGGDNSQTENKEKPQSAPKVVQIRIAEPLGMSIALWPELGDKDRVVPVEAPGRLTLEQGKRTRLKLSGIPNRPGSELFPTVEIPKLDATAEEFVTNAAIPIDFTDEDFNTVDKGGVTTKVVFLEKGRPTTIVSHDGMERGVVEKARKRGMVLAVVRIGNILGVVEPVRQGQDGPVKIEIGDDSNLPVKRSTKGQAVKIEIGDDSKLGVLRLRSDEDAPKAPEDKQLERLMRDVVKQRNEAIERLLQDQVRQMNLERLLREAVKKRQEDVERLGREMEKKRQEDFERILRVAVKAQQESVERLIKDLRMQGAVKEVLMREVVELRQKNELLRERAKQLEQELKKLKQELKGAKNKK